MPPPLSVLLSCQASFLTRHLQVGGRVGAQGASFWPGPCAKFVKERAEFVNAPCFGPRENRFWTHAQLNIAHAVDGDSGELMAVTFWNVFQTYTIQTPVILAGNWACSVAAIVTKETRRER